MLSEVPGLSDNQVRDLRHILPPKYMPGHFAIIATTTLSTSHSWHGDMILSYPSQVLH